VPVVRQAVPELVEGPVTSNGWSFRQAQRPAAVYQRPAAVYQRPVAVYQHTL
jgi:hypothetical protein